MSGQSGEAAELAALGLAARILLAYDDADADQMVRLVNTDPDAALNAITAFAAALALKVYGLDLRQALNSVATAADLDDIGRQVTG
ncbi:hypothetical protein F8271_24355 [Micromonospora sp. ALFpr18c]|uniref:hypothetical protein n=1 Tax=unclassified Micromonospora TaxID=2617518 RepID=UPI00124B364D|nr:hypothetical protein [Micromonospora sp. ALFpr18c]KAB1933432.1 hypothetical protein F8271_24355 [Micromonospora sp. ALFpr18c]